MASQQQTKSPSDEFQHPKTTTPKIGDQSLWELIGLKEWVALDLETTGLDPDNDAIIELGAVRFRDGSAVESFSMLVNPTTGRLPSEITDLTGITDKDLIDAPLLEQVAKSFADFVGEGEIVGHNIAFDLGFLTASPITARYFPAKRTIPHTHDTNIISRFIYPCLDSYGLKHLTTQLSTGGQPCHRAADDAAATGGLFGNLLQSMVQVPRLQIAQALRFVEGTASPLANTLRVVLQAQSEVYQEDQAAPDALRGPFSGRNNIYAVDGSARPSEAVPDNQIRQLFNDSNRLDAVISRYEIRPQQVDMALSVMQAFNNDKLLVTEAGTGVGKSLAYLVPALLSGDRIIISTYTKNLQDQLFCDEIPRLGEMFKFGFKAIILKGRRNYLCQTKWRNWTLNPERIVSPRLRESAALITRWVESTLTGDMSEINSVRPTESGGLFTLVGSEPGFCLGRICNGKNECSYARVRRLARKADLIIVNHSLVCADLAVENGILSEVKKIIFDEAHHLEGVATDHYSTELTAIGIKGTLERIARTCNRGGELWARLSADPRFDSLVPLTEKIANHAVELDSEIEKPFAALASMLRKRVPDNAMYSTPFRYNRDDDIHRTLVDTTESLSAGIKALVTKAVQLLKRIESEPEDDMPVLLVQEVQAATDELTSQYNTVELALAADEKSRVYWVEVPAELNRPISIRSAPLDVADLLGDVLWKRIEAAILTSATLASEPGPEGMRHIVNRLGLNTQPSERLLTAIYGSPFDYDKNCLVCYPSFLDNPSENPSAHLSTAVDIITEIAKRHRKGILCLFTSYYAMRRVNKGLNRKLLGSGLDVLIQTRRLGRDRLIRRFRKSDGAILLGTDSLWEGIDLPGSALEIVVIPKLPFDVPDDPVVAARIDRIREEGGSPFWEYQLPSAVLRMRQGAGRLIRSTTDRGVILVLDSRSVTKSYGLTFRRSIQGKPVVIKDMGELNDAIDGFFGESV